MDILITKLRQQLADKERELTAANAVVELQEKLLVYFRQQRNPGATIPLSGDTDIEAQLKKAKNKLDKLQGGE